ncbi:MAG TPA: rhamnulokinase family protein [Candidatus Dormibacteraeota bacterium]|nr:rhamnulokinase family protein [Candidatus Dormibacteraeota bacterium]
MGRRLAAVDLGAESGRVVAGSFDGERLGVREVHRFPNRPVAVAGTLHWDALRLFADVVDGLRAAGPVDSIAVDTWGVDFGLLDRAGRLLGNPVHYRDRRTAGMLAEADRRLPAAEAYARTGVQLLEINTVYQLLAMRLAGDPQLDAADRLVLMPALFSAWLGGTAVNELTDASTTGCYDPRAGGWALDVLERLDIPGRLFGEIVPPGTDLGPVLPALDLGRPRVVATASHDTASAVAAVPFEPGRAGAYVSSGTWSLVGVEASEPVIGPDALAANLTNEAGVDGTVRLLRNVMGLWLLQECRRAWAHGSYEDLTAMAEAAPPFGPLVDPDDQRFLRPAGDLPADIARACRERGQAAPREPGEVVRCVLESLALRCGWVLGRLEAVTGRRVEVVHVVGGGAGSRLLCQLTADACGRPVVAGPMEATAIGNLLVQARAAGLVGSLDEGRELVRRSFPLVRYEPRPDERWEQARARFEALLGAGERVL